MAIFKGPYPPKYFFSWNLVAMQILINLNGGSRAQKKNFRKIFNFDEINHPPGGPAHVSEIKNKKIKISETAFSFELKFCRKFKRPKIHLLSKFQLNSNFFRDFMPFFRFWQNRQNFGYHEIKISAIFLIYSLISVIRVIYSSFHF